MDAAAVGAADVQEPDGAAPILGGTSRLRVASYLGPRVSHCSSVDQNGTRTYWLTDPDGLLA